MKVCVVKKCGKGLQDVPLVIEQHTLTAQCKLNTLFSSGKEGNFRCLKTCNGTIEQSTVEFAAFLPVNS